MTPQHQAVQNKQSNWQNGRLSNPVLLLILLGVVGVMGFYSVTDVNRLANDHTLGGADWAGYAVCHRITARSFEINGRQLPLCARCTGMYLGVALTILVISLSGRLRYANLPPLKILLILIGFIGLMGIDGLNSFSHFFPNTPHLYQPRNWLRLLTGMGTGLAMGLIILPALAQTIWRTPRYVPVISNFRELFSLFLFALIAVGLILSNQPTLLYVLALVSIAGLLAIIATLNMVTLSMIFRRDGWVIGGWETAVPLLLGLTLAIIELSTISYLRFSLTGTMAGLPGL